jgi:hypothetical protein
VNSTLAKALLVANKEGRVQVMGLEYPEDFPPGKYFFVIENGSSASVPGNFDKLEIEANILAVGGLEALKKQKKK